MIIDKKKIGLFYKPYIIAEISANHKQSLSRAKKIIMQAKKAGASAIKIQTFDLKEMTLDLNNKMFTINNRGNLWNKKKLYNLYKKALTPKEWHAPIFEYCKKIGITCFTSVFDIKSLNFLDKFNLPAFKIASFENNHLPLIEEVIKRKKPVIISTGMSTMQDLEIIKKIFKKYNHKNFAFLKCTSSYPSNPKESNLSVIPYLRKKFNCEIGLSDHTPGIGVAVSSIAHGASLIEKHIKLNSNDGSLDEKFSLNPKKFKDLVFEANNAWKAIGKKKLFITNNEKKFLFLKRSIFISRDVTKGEKLKNENIKIIRPGYGLSPKNFNKILNRYFFKKSFKKGTPLKLNMIVK